MHAARSSTQSRDPSGLVQVTIVRDGRWRRARRGLASESGSLGAAPIGWDAGAAAGDRRPGRRDVKQKEKDAREDGRRRCALRSSVLGPFSYLRSGIVRA